MKRLFLLASILCITGCNSSSTFFVKESLARLPSGDEVTTMAEMHTYTCKFKQVTSTVRMETTWTRAGQPDRILTVHGDMTGMPNRQALQTRCPDADHIILTREDGQPLASFDYDHARAYFGPAAQPEWTRVQSARAGN